MVSDHGYGNLIEFLVSSKTFTYFSSDYSYLTGRDELQRAQSGLQVGSVALQVEQGLSNVALQLAGLGVRGAVGGDLVDGGHFD